MKHIEELFLFDEKFACPVVGTDEAGRGPAAGGVFAAAVYFPDKNEALIKQLEILNDSKQLSKKKRELLFDVIKNETINSVGCVDVEEIERINILNSSLKSMRLACNNVISNLKTEDVLVLVDGNKLATGKGSSKKNAQQMAAYEAILLLKKSAVDEANLLLHLML
jgi:ribonuclease HII